MARRLQLPYICLSIFLLILPLVCSKDEENNGLNDVGELLQKLLKAEKERRTMSDDTNVDGSEGTEQEPTKDDEKKLDIEFEKGKNGVNENVVKVDGEVTEKIIQDCENKYELIMDKGDDKARGACYFHKMDDSIYKKNCNGTGTGGEIDVKYKKGDKIEDNTLLSKIKGIDECMERDVFELIPISVKRRDLNEYEKRLTAGRRCYYCVYITCCNWVCTQKAGWWWGEHCVGNTYTCTSYCSYDFHC